MNQTSRMLELAIICLSATLMIGTTGCNKEVHVVKKMTWICEPASDQLSFPGVQTERLRYVEAPAYSELEPGMHLCDQLRGFGKPEIEVHFTVFGNSWSGMRGYRTIAIDGISYAPGGSWGSSRQDGPSPAPFPLDGVIQRHRVF